jgi:hypothetical protein
MSLQSQEIVDFHINGKDKILCTKALAIIAFAPSPGGCCNSMIVLAIPVQKCQGFGGKLWTENVDSPSR